MANATIALQTPNTMLFLDHVTYVPVLVTLSSTTYTNGTGFNVDFAPIYTLSQTGTNSTYGALNVVTDQPWGVNTAELMLSAIQFQPASTMAGFTFIPNLVTNQPTQLNIQVYNGAASGSAGGEISTGSLTGSLYVILAFAKGSTSYFNAGTGA